MDGVGEVRNILFLLSKRLESLDQKLSEVAVVANQAKERSNLANQLIFNQKNHQHIDYEIQLIRKLFGGSGPSLSDMLPMTNDDSGENDSLLGILSEVFTTGEDQFLTVVERDDSPILNKPSVGETIQPVDLNDITPILNEPSGQETIQPVVVTNDKQCITESLPETSVC